MFAEVLVEYGVKSLDKTFTYKVPDDLVNKLKIGMKVKVPFASKNINGFVIDIKDNFDDNFEIKEIDSIVDEYLVLNKELLELGKYLKKQTLCSLITAYQTMLPGSLKVKNQKRNFTKYETYIELNWDENLIQNYILENQRKKKQIEILEMLLVDKSI